MNTETTQMLTELNHEETAMINGGGSRRRRYILGNYWYSNYAASIWNSINDWEAKRQSRWAGSFNTFNSWN
jgi:hypothetical protein